MKLQKYIFALGFALATTLAITTPTQSYAQTSAVTQLEDQSFFKKRNKIRGSWSLVERDGKTFVSFSENFRTKKGPDLKIFLSPKTADEVTGKNAVDGSLNIGELKKTKGAQEYEIPEGTVSYTHLTLPTTPYV